MNNMVPKKKTQHIRGRERERARAPNITTIQSKQAISWNKLLAQKCTIDSIPPVERSWFSSLISPFFKKSDIRQYHVAIKILFRVKCFIRKYIGSYSWCRRWIVADFNVPVFSFISSASFSYSNAIYRHNVHCAHTHTFLLHSILPSVWCGVVLFDVSIELLYIQFSLVFYIHRKKAHSSN